MKVSWELLAGPMLLLGFMVVAGGVTARDPFRVEIANAAVETPLASPPKLVSRPGPIAMPQKESPEQARLHAAMQKDLEATIKEAAGLVIERQRVQELLRATEQKTGVLRKELRDSDRLVTDTTVSARVETEIEKIQDVLQSQKDLVGTLETQLKQSSLQEGAKQPLAATPPVPRVATGNKLPMLVELVHSRAIPIKKKYFDYHRVNWFGVVAVTRKVPGEDAAEVASSRSEFQKYLDEIKPSKQYLACLLNSDSFEIFRTVREIAKKRGIAVGWEPVDSSSGKITVYPARLSKKANAKQPRVTAILEEP